MISIVITGGIGVLLIVLAANIIPNPMGDMVTGFIFAARGEFTDVSITEVRMMLEETEDPSLFNPLSYPYFILPKECHAVISGEVINMGSMSAQGVKVNCILRNERGERIASGDEWINIMNPDERKIFNFNIAYTCDDKPLNLDCHESCTHVC